MDTIALFKQLQRVLQVTKAAKLDIDLSYTMFMVLMGLLKKIAIHLQVDFPLLVNEAKAPTVILARINDLIFNDFDYDKRTYGLMSQEIFKVLAEVLKTEKAVEEIQVMELLEKLNDVGLALEAKSSDESLDMPVTIPAVSPEKSPITEIESKQKKNSEKKA